MAVVGLGKRGAGFDDKELLHQGREQVRVATGSKFSEIFYNWLKIYKFFNF